MVSVYQALFLFIIYSFLGWCVEVSFVAVTSGRVVNRGFLNGPVCPIYGVGMLGVLLLLAPISKSLPLLFLGGGVLCSLVELVGGWVLEQVFHTRWWDYSQKHFNLKGYICLEFSIMWGLAVTFAVRLIHPMILSLVNAIPTVVGFILLGVAYGLFLADFIVTIVTIVGIRKRLGELQRVAAALHSVGDNLSDRVGNSALAADAKLDEVREAGQERLAENLDAAKEMLEEVKQGSKEKLEEVKLGSMEKLEELKQESLEKRAEAKAASRERREKLERRQRELLQALSEAPRFGTRRLNGAFPTLKQGLKSRLEELKR